MKFWIDDVRPAPYGYRWVKSVNEAKKLLSSEFYRKYVDLIDIDHDAGEYVKDGGDYIKLLDWMETVGYTPDAIHIHSMNSVGVENMRRIIHKNGWREV